MLEKAFAGFHDMIFTEEELEMREGRPNQKQQARFPELLSSSRPIFC
jgi:hypothetical protein